MRHTARMHSDSLYHRHRFPAEIISHSVWLYFRFALSFRDVEEMLAMRGVSLTYETVREWCLKFGQSYANCLRRRAPRPGRLSQVNPFICCNPYLVFSPTTHSLQ
jgi:transposase-like protein